MADKKESVILEIILATLKLLTSNESKQVRRNIRRALKNYKKIRKLMKEDGISIEERAQLDSLIDALVEAQEKHLK